MTNQWYYYWSVMCVYSILLTNLSIDNENINERSIWNIEEMWKKYYYYY